MVYIQYGVGLVFLIISVAYAFANHPMHAWFWGLCGAFIIGAVFIGLWA
jgi:hypothetical protein